jgi:thiamine transport system ATP-binding protein
VVMRAGRIEQVGAPQEVWEVPATEFVARFLGYANVLDATIDRDGVQCAWGHVAVAPDGRIGSVRLAARPDALRIADDGTVRGRVTRVIFRRDHFLVHVETDAGGFDVAAAVAPALGATVGLALDPRSLVVLGT